MVRGGGSASQRSPGGGELSGDNCRAVSFPSADTYREFLRLAQPYPMNTPNSLLPWSKALQCAALVFTAQVGLFQAAAQAPKPAGPPPYRQGGLVPPPTKELI